MSHGLAWTCTIEKHVETKAYQRQHGSRSKDKAKKRFQRIRQIFGGSHSLVADQIYKRGKGTTQPVSHNKNRASRG
eukprot:363891-Chlamydomonas_euryale.AAC.14